MPTAEQDEQVTLKIFEILDAIHALLTGTKELQITKNREVRQETIEIRVVDVK